MRALQISMVALLAACGTEDAAVDGPLVQLHLQNAGDEPIDVRGGVNLSYITRLHDSRTDSVAVQHRVR